MEGEVNFYQFIIYLLEHDDNAAVGGIFLLIFFAIIVIGCVGETAFKAFARK